MLTFAIVVCGILFCGAAGVAAYALASRRRTTVGQIAGYGFSGAEPVDLDVERPRRDLATALGEFVARRRAGQAEGDIRRRLVAAGVYKVSPRQFVGFQVLAAAGLFLFWLAVGGAAGLNTGIYVFGLVVFPVLGWFAPKIVLDRMVKRRFEEIDRRLPDLIDLLVVSVEAGVGFSGSLQMVTSQMDGPLGQELRITIQEQNMGLTTSEALQGLVRRVETPGLRTFVRSVIQGETLGVSIGQILRNIADEMRKKRKAAAEEKAQKAPIKMLFPLVFLIFPALFVILLVPALITIWRTLS